MVSRQDQFFCYTQLIPFRWAFIFYLFINFTSSFSKLKLVKNDLRSTMSQDRLVDLARLSIESEIAKKISFDNVITNFALKKARKAPLNAIVK